jgi:hypothetical protein
MRFPPIRCGTLCALFAAAAVAAPTLSGQTADTIAFRAGQWGAEFSLGGSFTGLGVQRFSTPKRAWVASLRGRFDDVNVDDDEVDSDLPTPPPWANAFAFENRSGDARVGHRWYRSIAPRVQQHLTIGALASVSRVKQFRDDLPDFTSRSTGAGVFADLGALWLLTPRLSLGAAWTASLTRVRTNSTVYFFFNEETTTGSMTTRTTGIRFGDVRMQGAVYF